MKSLDVRMRMTPVCLVVLLTASAAIQARPGPDEVLPPRRLPRARPQWQAPQPSAPQVDSVIKDDFPCNDDSYGGTLHDEPSVAVDSAGNLVIVWYDYRDGNADCWFQRFNASGTRVGANERVNSDVTLAAQNWPSAAMGRDGRFLFAWDDRREWGASELYYQRYDPAGNRIGDNSMVTDTSVEGDQIWSDARFAPDGGFLVAWDDRRFGLTGDIFARFYNPDGMPIDSCFRVNDDPIGFANQYHPEIDCDDSGRFIMVWQDGRNIQGSDWNIFCQRFTSDGTRLGANLQVTTDRGVQNVPDVGALPSGEFLVCWADERKGETDRDVFARVYDSSGQPVCEEFRVNDDLTVSNQHMTTAAGNRYGEFLVVWADARDGDEDIYGQFYRANGDTIGSNFRINAAVAGYQTVPDVEARPDGGYWVAWADGRNGHVDIYARQVSRTGGLVGNEFRVNDDSASSRQAISSLGMSAGGRICIAWEDTRNINSDIYATVLDPSGGALCPNLRVNDDAPISHHWYAAVGAGRDRFLVTWVDTRSGTRIFGQYLDHDGSRTGANFQVDSDTGGARGWNPYCAMDDSNQATVVWRDARPVDGYTIFARRFGPDRSPLGPEFPVPESVGHIQEIPGVAANRAGRFVAAWMDFRNSSNRRPDIYCRLFGPDGSPLTGDIRVDSDNGDCWQGYPAPAVADDGRFAVAWEDVNDVDCDVCLQFFDSTGTRLGPALRVNDGTPGPDAYGPSCDFGPDGRLMVLFDDEREAVGNPQIYGQRYDVHRTPLGRNQRISGPRTFPGNARWTYGQSVAASSDVIAATWTDNCRHQGFDIYAKLMDWELIGVADHDASGFATQDWLRPTVSTSRLLRLSPDLLGTGTPLTVIDATGRTVLRTTVSCPAFDLSALGAGVYFVRLAAGDRFADRKLVLLE